MPHFRLISEPIKSSKNPRLHLGPIFIRHNNSILPIKPIIGVLLTTAHLHNLNSLHKFIQSQQVLLRNKISWVLVLSHIRWFKNSLALHYELFPMLYNMQDFKWLLYALLSSAFWTFPLFHLLLFSITSQSNFLDLQPFNKTFIKWNIVSW